VVVYGVSTDWNDKLSELKEHIQRENGVMLSKTPHWLTREDTKKRGTLDIVIHVAKRQISEGLLAKDVNSADGYTYNAKDVKEYRIREYVPKAVMREIQCTTCYRFGHMYMNCPARGTNGAR
jgi:hypothetical protein